MALVKFQREGVISLEYGAITILDPEGLEKRLAATD